MSRLSELAAEMARSRDNAFVATFAPVKLRWIIPDAGFLEPVNVRLLPSNSWEKGQQCCLIPEFLRANLNIPSIFDFRSPRSPRPSPARPASVAERTTVKMKMLRRFVVHRLTADCIAERKAAEVPPIDPTISCPVTPPSPTNLERI